MLECAAQEIDADVLLPHERVAQEVCRHKGAQGPDCVGEQRMRPVEGMDVPQVPGQRGPAGCLHCPARLEGDLVE